MKDIMLKIVGKQVMKDGKGDSEEQVMEFMTEGQLYERNGSTYLMYKETELSGMEGCTTSLKISGDTVRMKRFGQMLPIDTVMEEGELDIDYAISLKGLTEARSRLNITIVE